MKYLILVRKLEFHFDYVLADSWLCVNGEYNFQKKRAKKRL